MKTYNKEDLKSIPMIRQCHVYQEWINESNLPQEYLGKLAILVPVDRIKSKWTFEGVDFKVVE